MNFNTKAFFAVIVITVLVFAILRPLFLCLMSKEDFALRRNVWLYLTVVGFLSPDYWLFFFLTVPVLVFAARKDSNPAALYLFLLLALPPVQKAIPTFGIINQVFNLDHLRVMSLTVLLPTAISLLNRPRHHAAARVPWLAPDIMVIGYVVLQLLLLAPYESPTNTMRRALLVGLDILLPYFVLSRSCNSVWQVKEAVGALAAAAILLCPLALLEMFWASMLFSGFEEHWQLPMMYLPLFRGSLLRAQVTAGHSIVFGNFCAIALCGWWVVKKEVEPKTLRDIGSIMVTAALIASLARGPLLGAIVGAMTYTLLGRRSKRGLLQAAGVVVVLAFVLLSTPYGASLLEYVPFVGSADDQSVTYRQRLLELSLSLIAENPLLGTPGFIQYMESLQQGQGIIDLVNGQLTIALSYGLVGLGLFLGAFGAVVWRCSIRPDTARDDAWRQAGIGISAAVVASMTILVTASNYLSITYVYWAVAGLGCALLRLPVTGARPAEIVSRSNSNRLGHQAHVRRRTSASARS